MGRNTFIAAAVQMEVEYEPLAADATIGHILHAADEAADHGARLVVFPETANAEWFFENPEAAAKVAGTKDGWFVQALAAKAKERDIYIASGLTELDPSTGKLYNSTILVGPDGQAQCLYRKHFLIGYDKRWATPGDNGFPVAQTGLGNIAAFICADARIPEVARCPSVDGAQILVNTSNWGGTDQYTSHVPSRAAENRVWVVAANKSGRDQPGKPNVGNSIIVDPDGRIIARAENNGPEIIYAEIDPSAADDKRWGGLDLFQARRPELYADLLTPTERIPLIDVLDERVRPDDITAGVSAVQVSFREDAEKTLALALEYADYARHRSYTDLVVLPELFLFRPGDVAQDPGAAADLSARAVEAFKPLCAKGNLYAVLSLVERGPGERCYSTAFLVHPSGQVDTYRKTHLTAEEARWATPGEEFPVFRTRFGNLAIMLGQEGLIPEVARCLTLRGADIVCWPTAWRHELDYKLIAVERVLENRISLVASNRLDAPVPGPSLILQGLLSRSLSSAASWETVVGEPDQVTALCNFALSRSKRIMPNTDVLLHRQPQFYQSLIRPRVETVATAPPAR